MPLRKYQPSHASRSFDGYAAGTSAGSASAIALTRAFTAAASPCCHAITNARQSAASARWRASSIPGIGSTLRSRRFAGSCAGSAPSSMMSPIEAHGRSAEPSPGGIIRSDESRNCGSITESAPFMASISLAVRIRSFSMASSCWRTGSIFRTGCDTSPDFSKAFMPSASAGSAASAACAMRARTSLFLT